MKNRKGREGIFSAFFLAQNQAGLFLREWVLLGLVMYVSLTLLFSFFFAPSAFHRQKASLISTRSSFTVRVIGAVQYPGDYQLKHRAMTRSAIEQAKPFDQAQLASKKWDRKVEYDLLITVPHSKHSLGEQSENEYFRKFQKDSRL